MNDGPPAPRASAIRAAAGVAILAAIAVVVAVPSERSASAPAHRARAFADRALPRPVQPAGTVPEPRALDRRPSTTWAPILRGVAARQEPSAAAAPVGDVSAVTPEGTQNIVTVLGTTQDAVGRLWARVSLALLPNGTTGWVPRRALGGYGIVTTHLVVDTDSLTATLYRRGRRIFSAPVGVGRAAWPTPTGRFYIRNRLTGFDDPAYGPLAFGTSARSDVLTDWPAGGFIGIHGTDQPELLPGRVSHGCIRLRNEDIEELGRLMPLGTPVTIR